MIEIAKSAERPKSQGFLAEDASAVTYIAGKIKNHKVLNEGCESRNSHRYAVIVHELATQWLQAYPCTNHDLTGNDKEFAKGSRAESQSRGDSYREFTGIWKSM